MIGITVKGGTNAGCRIVKRLRSWWCDCEGPDGMILHPGTDYSCAGCGARRP